MAETVTFDLSGWDRALRGTLSALVNKDDLLVRAFNIIGIRDLVSHFKDQAGPKDRWRARKTETQNAYERVAAGFRKPASGTPRAAYNPSNRILQLTGNLRQSVLNPDIKKQGKDTIAVSSKSEYGAAHDEGSTKRGLPQREFMWLSSQAESSMLEAIMQTVAKGGL